MKVCNFLLIILFFLASGFLFGQVNQNDTNMLKSKIEVLYKNQDIATINRMIHEDNSLEPEYVFEKLNRNIEISMKNNNEQVLADTYIVLGNFWHQQANKLKAFENYLQAENISRKTDDKRLLATALMNKSTLLEDKQEKVKTLQEASGIFSELNDSVNLIKAYLNIGVVYGQLYEEANESLYSLAEIQGFKNKSFRYYSDAGKLNQTLNNRELEGVLHVYYGEWYKHERQFEEAIRSFQKAQNILADTKNTKAQTYCVFMLAKIYHEMKRYEDAHELFKQAENLAEKYKFNDYLVRIYDEYIKLYTEQDNLSQALVYSKLYADKSIELAEQSNDDKMQILSLEKNIAENKLQLNEYEAKSKVNRILIFSSSLIALFIGGISYLIIKNNNRKINNIEQNKIITDLEKSAIEIKLKNQLLEEELLKEKVKFSQSNLITFANQVNKIDNFLDDLKSEMKGDINSEKKQEKINNLKVSFAEVLNNQNELKQINSLSSELNQEFFFHIRKNYPSITKEDEQLLSYLILNLSNKEISKKLNISIKSLYTKRYRLRKKLDLEENEKLIDFYKKVVDEFVV